MRLIRRSLVTIALVAMAGSAAAGQSWQALAVASFDDIWQTIQDSYHDPTFGGIDWVGVRDTLRPRVTAAASPDEARGVMRDMLGRIGQSHFVLLAPLPGDVFTGDAAPRMRWRVVEGAMAVVHVDADSATSRSGLRAGDRLVSIDGASVDRLKPADLPDGRASHAAWWRAVERAVKGPAGSAARLELRAPSGAVRTLEVPREVESGELVTLGNLPPQRVRTASRLLRTAGGSEAGLISFNVWFPAVDAPVAEAVDRYRGSDGIVLDLRGNPGGLADMMRGIAGHFLGEPQLIGRMKMRHLDLEFRANPRRSTASGRRVEPFAGPLAILVDDLTGSSSECFAGGLQSLRRARVFGTITMGQALPASTRQLPNGDAFLYAVGDFITSTGHRLEGTGVIPDEVTPLTIDALAAGRDVALEAALRWIDRSLGRAPR
jgi:carboxyl-terminal processing protease